MAEVKRRGKWVGTWDGGRIWRDANGKGNTPKWVGQQRLHLAWWAKRLGRTLTALLVLMLAGTATCYGGYVRGHSIRPEESAPESEVLVDLREADRGRGAEEWLRLTLSNRGDHTVIVRWDRLALVDSRGKSHGVSKRGLKNCPGGSEPCRAVDLAVGAPASTSIPPGGSVEESEICPTDRVKVSTRVWTGEGCGLDKVPDTDCLGWLPDPGKEDSVSVVLALEVDGREVTQTHRFKVLGTKTEVEGRPFQIIPPR